jgi:hypothetical protein
VTDEIVPGEISNNSFILQLVDNMIFEAVKLEQKNATLNDASSCTIPEMQNVVIFEVAKAGIQVLKQV